MALASKYLAASPPEHARATTPQGSCTTGVGLDVKTFRGFQLAEELFLLTSFFIEPKVQPSAESLRKLSPTCVNATFGAVRQADLTSGESTVPPHIGHSRALGLGER